MPHLQAGILKKLHAPLLVLACCVAAHAQSPPTAGAHGLVVKKSSWRSYRPGWDRRRGAAMGPPRDSTGKMNPPLVIGADPVPRLGYLYKAKVENAGRREARAVVWEYRFIEKGTRRVTAHRFRAVRSLRPGAKAELKGFSYAQPSEVVGAESAGRKHREAFDEEVVIVRVEYADGGVWALE
jgi:hypothetical protein